jgi:hypothetical protein
MVTLAGGGGVGSGSGGGDCRLLSPQPNNIRVVSTIPAILNMVYLPGSDGGVLCLSSVPLAEGSMQKNILICMNLCLIRRNSQ